MLVYDLADALLRRSGLLFCKRFQRTYQHQRDAWRERSAEKLIADAKRRWNMNLKAEFGDRKAALITTADLQTYVLKRHKDGAKNATINREMAFLRRAFKIG